ncbi:hypothetical protein CW304_23910 [Bacillus sp. UFRGS-B20]|nr:hypothetical protein CW304_23910 [Bacillus sp. UFRGS-B20]
MSFYTVRTELDVLELYVYVYISGNFIVCHLYLHCWLCCATFCNKFALQGCLSLLLIRTTVFFANHVM